METGRGGYNGTGCGAHNDGGKGDGGNSVSIKTVVVVILAVIETEGWQW